MQGYLTNFLSLGVSIVVCKDEGSESDYPNCEYFKKEGYCQFDVDGVKFNIGGKSGKISEVCAKTCGYCQEEKKPGT